MSPLTILIYLFYAYLLLGLIFGLWFVFRGVQKMDAGMESAPWKLRLMLLPGAMAFWLVLLFNKAGLK